eukprot:4539021-Amphidinium_carterae.1
MVTTKGQPSSTTTTSTSVSGINDDYDSTTTAYTTDYQVVVSTSTISNHTTPGYAVSPDQL